MQTYIGPSRGEIPHHALKIAVVDIPGDSETHAPGSNVSLAGEIFTGIVGFGNDRLASLEKDLPAFRHLNIP
ncbi:hypothetical protein ABK730_14805 [Klebsiella indica]|uniref:hypothetical protein n=1 Tax=Klebsiella TaxID=570 RepID=UPI0021B018D0|nr:hypothetical protein [Klebsiella sp. 2680]